MDEQASDAFAALLRQQRLAAGLTQEALAERAGLGVRSIQGLEGGESRPLRDTARRLTAALGLEGEARVRFLAASGPAPRAHLLKGASRSMAAPAADFVEPVPAPQTHNLPLQLTRFVGRTHEIAEAAALLGQTRLLTLTGTGGVGKTRLALEVAAAVHMRYPQGAWLVELAALADPMLLPQAVVAALGVREQPGRPLEETLLDALRTQRLLLLLDNCEHLRDACARFAERLLRACADVQILVTSREPLGLAGETAWRVPSLALPEPDPERLRMLAALAQVEAVQLFVERAQAVQPRFALTATNATAVMQVCRRLDGIPLALELAAAQVRALGAEQLAARMDQQFRLLSGGSRTALPRQQTLRATVDWSYALLSDHERILFARLAVFAGSFSLEAAEVVGAGGVIATEAVLGLLVRLVDTSLVLVVAEGAGDEGAELRYRLLEPLRQYAQERLEADDAEDTAAREQHAAYYLALAEAAEPHLKGPEQLAWLERLRTERDNLRTAAAWLVARGAAEEALRLEGALYWFRVLCEGWIEHGAWLTQVLALPGAGGPSPARAKALGTAGLAAMVQGETAAGRRLLEEAVVLARQLDDPAALAWALLWLGVLVLSQGDYPRAHSLFEESLAHYRSLGDNWGITEVLCRLGHLVVRAGDYQRARTLLDEAWALARHRGERRQIGYVLEVRGEVAYATGDLAEAERLWAESLDQYIRLGDPLGIVTIEIFLGNLALRAGDVTTARARYTASLEHQRGWRAAERTLRALAGLAMVAGAEGQADRTLRLAAAVLAAGTAAGFRLPGPEQEALDRAIAHARAAKVEHAATVWAEGQALSLEEAVSYALEPGAAG